MGEIKGGLKGNVREEHLSWEAQRKQCIGILAKPGAGKERELIVCHPGMRRR